MCYADASIPRSTNHRRSRLSSIRAARGPFSDRIEWNARTDAAGTIDGRPVVEFSASNRSFGFPSAAPDKVRIAASG